MKHYKLIENTGNNQIDYLMEFSSDKRIKIEKKIRFGKDNQPPYLLIVKESNKIGVENYTDLKAIHNPSELLKIIGANTCFDYTGMTLVVWKNKKAYSWESYKELIY